MMVIILYLMVQMFHKLMTGDKINLDGVDSSIVTSQSGQILEKISGVCQGQQINGHRFENVTDTTSLNNFIC